MSTPKPLYRKKQGKGFHCGHHNCTFKFPDFCTNRAESGDPTCCHCIGMEPPKKQRRGK